MAREIPLLLLPLQAQIQHLRRRLAQLDAAVKGSKKLVLVVSNADTLPLSYQTTPHFIRMPSLHPLPPLTHTARVSACRSNSSVEGGGVSSSRAQGHLLSF